MKIARKIVLPEIVLAVLKISFYYEDGALL
jgi:hypothetical protein